MNSTKRSAELKKPMYSALLAAFPDIEKAFHEKLQEGYKLVSVNYESIERTGHEMIIVVFNKGYERFVLQQGKGSYAGGFSHAIFGREGEKGEVL